MAAFGSGRSRALSCCRPNLASPLSTVLASDDALHSHFFCHAERQSCPIMRAPKWLVTMSVDAMGPKSSAAGHYARVGRLIDLDYAERPHGSDRTWAGPGFQ